MPEGSVPHVRVLQDGRALTPETGSSVARIMDEREKRVLGFMVAGLHSAEIAAELGINGSMAKTLMNSVLVELGAYGNPRPLPPGQRPVRFSDDWHLVRLQKLLRQRWRLDAVEEAARPSLPPGRDAVGQKVWYLPIPPELS